MIFKHIYLPLDGTLTGITTRGQSGSQSNGNEGVIWFYGISTIVDYLMLNPVNTYILNIWFVNTF